MESAETEVGLQGLSLEESLFSKLGADELRLIVDQLDEDDAFAFASTCRAFRTATCLAGSATARFGERSIRTTWAGAWASVARLRWAVAQGYKTKSGHLARSPAVMGRLADARKSATAVPPTGAPGCLSAAKVNSLPSTLAAPSRVDGPWHARAATSLSATA